MHTGNSGVARNGSAFTSGNPNAPEGDQVAFLQQTAALSQTVAGWDAGSYTIKLRAAQRGNNNGGQTLEVRVDGVTVATITPSGSSYVDYTTASFTVAAGDHSVEIRGTSPLGGDNTAFVDHVRIVAAAPGGPQVRWTVHDGHNPYADFDGAGTLQDRYLHGPAVDWLLARTSASGTSAWYLTDRLGSVRDVASTSGTVIDHVAYDGFGRITGETSPASGDRFKYTGREYDGRSQLQYNRARYYDAVIGRWTQEDPIGFAAGDPNLYRYVGNQPTGFTDPSGLSGIGDVLYITGQGFAGIGQGVLNTANGVQDGVVELINLPAHAYNNTIYYAGGGIVPYVPSPDWSRDVCVHESDTTHGLSKTVGGISATILISYPSAVRSVAGKAIGTTRQAGCAASRAWRSAVGWMQGSKPTTCLRVAPGSGAPKFRVAQPGEAVNIGRGDALQHFTDAKGAAGITGVPEDVLAGLKTGQQVVVDAAHFKPGANPFLTGEGGGVGVTKLGSDAIPGQLEGVGVFGAKQQYVIEFSQETVVTSGVQMRADLPSRNC